MQSKSWNPLRLDVQAFARSGEFLQGEWPSTAMSRLAEVAAAESPAAGWAAVRWSLQGEEQAVLGGESEVWLQLRVSAEASPTCQRCLQPVRLPLEVDGRFRFVRDEAQAEALDAELEEDVLVLSRAFDVREWVEDELLLALPIVPLHEVCPRPLPLAVEPKPEPIEERPNPFAVLQALKTPERGGGPT